MTRRVKLDPTSGKVHKQLALLYDIAIAEKQKKVGMVSSHDAVKKRATQWLK